MPEKSSSNVDIFGLLSVDKEEEAKKKRRRELLASTGVKEFFPEGKMSIDKRTCWGVECKLCIDKCPTNALYWKAGEVGIVEDLCVYCGACVLCCMVDDCIKVERKREDGTTERYSKPKDVVKLQDRINAKKRFQRVKEVFPTSEAYCERYEHEK
jgi:Na+-translocating ferredoxin:NAD+ oxidoreductase RNF subunit RnfB